MDYPESNVLSQIRELQCAIDEFTKGKYDEDDKISVAEPEEDDEEGELYAEKVQLEDVDLTLQLPIDDDFSSLVDQLNAIEILPDTATQPIAESCLTYEPSPSRSLPVKPLPLLPPPVPMPAAPRRSRSGNSAFDRNRRTSISSKKSNKSLRSFRHIQERPQHKQQYHARTYAEMMRIPMHHERIAFYKKTFDLCMQADSQLPAWINQQKAKGLPKPMTEGYRPPPRPVLSPVDSRRDECKMTPSLSGSISMFLRKSMSTTFGNGRGYADTPKPVPNRLCSASRLSLAQRSSRYPLRVAPLTKDRPPPILFRSTKLPQSPKDDALNEICSILPYIDRRVLSGYLQEAGGDSMTAITLAVSQLRKPTLSQSRP
ncbi:hypothetical protein DFQ28_000697 [Apophysomyces sp. BC1034]|nr:hypothetical protein DFQ30_007850 [Apophysomyces sp. BC1015]KAG0181924.1 hypothetical protein DFQ29_006456 [Apophysomyces sp. BC1021]KAG0183868.1 hypothetical protein DFQ28_000697 [Apophysomyces sp. BC1034]